MIQRIKTWWRTLHEQSLFVRPQKRHYFVGDVLPQEVFERKGDLGMGAMISVDPETRVIKAIFIP